MIEERRVSLMTKLTIYEEKERHKAVAMSRYYKRDYVRYNVLKTWVGITISYWACFAAYIYMNFGEVLAQINQYDYFDIMYKLLKWYAMLSLAYFLFSGLVYNIKYEKAKPGLAEYNGNLKRLIAIDSGEPEPVGTVVEDEGIFAEEPVKLSERKMSADDKRTRVSRMELMRKQQQIENEKKEQEIIENVRKRNERVAAKNEMLSKQQKEAEEDRQRIRERRQQIEREQMERLRTERMHKMQQINRQDHTYSEKVDDSEGGNV